MRKITIIKVFLLFSLVLITTNCATEEIGRENTQTASGAKMWFDNNKSNYKETVLKFINELQWENSIVTNGEIGEVIEVPFTLANNLNTTNKDAALFNDHHRLMFVKDKNEEFKLFYVQIFSNDKNYDILDTNYNYYNIKDNFDGEVYVQELSSSKGARLEFANGKKVQQSLTAKMQEYHCVYYGYWGSGGSFTALYEVGCYGGGPTGDPETPGTVYGGGTGTPPHPSSSCPAGYSYKFGECILDQKIFNELTGKAKCIYERLLSTTSFYNAIKKFDGDFSVSHLKLTINNNLDANVFAITKVPENYITEIQFDNTKLSILSDLGNATVFAHEIIHAEIFRKMLSAAQQGSLNYNNMNTQQQIAFVNSLKDNYPGLMDYYYNRTHPTWNHNMMASHYRGIIADVIQQFDNYKLSRSTYESLSWLGLGKLGGGLTTPAWDSLSSAQQEEITKLINDNLYKGPSNCN